MSAQQLKMVAIGLAVLLLLWGGSELFSRGSDTVTGSLAFPALAPADVDSIVVMHGSDSVVLVKQSATAWTVNGHRAVAADVTDLLRAFKDTVRPELVAQDASSFARLQVDSATGRWLRVFRGGTRGAGDRRRARQRLPEHVPAPPGRRARLSLARHARRTGGAARRRLA